MTSSVSQRWKWISYRCQYGIQQLPTRAARLWRHIFISQEFQWAYQDISAVWKRFALWIMEIILFFLELFFVFDVVELVLIIFHPHLRSINDDQLAVGQRIFGDSIVWRSVKLNPKSKWARFFDAWAFVGLHTIHYDEVLPMDVFVHELTHIWQYEQVGVVYIPRALYAQRSTQGYSYGGGFQLSKDWFMGRSFRSYNYEQQAQIVQDYYILAQRMRQDPIVLAQNSIAMSYRQMLMEQNMLEV